MLLCSSNSVLDPFSNSCIMDKLTIAKSIDFTAVKILFAAVAAVVPVCGVPRYMIPTTESHRREYLSGSSAAVTRAYKY
jgi:hypothetical protein